MGEEWRSVLGCKGGIGMWGRYGSLCGVSVKIVLKWGKVCWGAGMWRSPHTLLHLLYTSPPTSTLTRHLFPHSPNTSPTRLYTLSHTHLPTLSHTFQHSSHFPHTFPHLPLHSPHLTSFFHLPQHFPRTHSPHFLTTSAPSPTLPHTLSFTPYHNFSLFSFIAKLV